MSQDARRLPPVPPSALERLPPEPEPEGPAEGMPGTREQRARLLVIIWLLSLVVTGIGFVLMLWILTHGGL
jgi:hypothetical protein